ncbi:hypothetical protein MML48_3g00001421 [Holotrichia oblita]|uniref:Uncharacterized protein n=1 Tax=Holotrichia oblita TaxID=644536 RepID=A0ACB9TEM7_HOLOL|nr:hypothetical protein MML48_3g00001421 [Holotrichia oblita]
MAFTENTVLLHTNQENVRTTTLSLFFAIVCIIDIFGVFPIITLPKTIIDCGKCIQFTCVYGLIVVPVICLLQIYTATLLGKSWLLACKIQSNFIQKERYPYTALAELAFGRKLSKCVTILLNITVFGGGIPNLIVASQNLNLFSIKLFGMDISYCWWILVIGTFLCPVLWLGSPKDMKLICSLSVLTVASVFFVVIICLLQLNLDPQNMQEEDGTNFEENSIWINIVIAYGVLIFQFDIHPTILAIQIDMEKRHKINLAIFYGFGGKYL